MTVEDERSEPPEESGDEQAPQADDAVAEQTPQADAAAEQPQAEDAAAEQPRQDEDAPGDAQPGDAAAEQPAQDEVPAQDGGVESVASERAEALPEGADEPAPGTVEPAAQGQDPAPRREQRRERDERAPSGSDEVVPGADLEPDLVLDQPARRDPDDEYGDAAAAQRYADAEPELAPEDPAAPVGATPAADAGPRTPMQLAADARYIATGKRKTSVARVILKPGSGTWSVNGRTLEDFFPRQGLQHVARQPLAAAGYEARMDVVARLHGGGVSAQAGALRHGVARALVEADPALRGELKRHGYLTRDQRSKERKKAGLKKARKRPQFSKR